MNIININAIYNDIYKIIDMANYIGHLPNLLNNCDIY